MCALPASLQRNKIRNNNARKLFRERIKNLRAFNYVTHFALPTALIALHDNGYRQLHLLATMLQMRSLNLLRGSKDQDINK